MEESHRRRILRYFDFKELDPLLLAFTILEARGRDKGADFFEAISAAIIDLALDGLDRTIARIRPERKPDSLLRGLGSLRIISGLNSALPLKHPSAFVVISVLNPNVTVYASVPRASIPGAHDILQPNFVPHFECDEREDVANGKLRFVRLITDTSDQPDTPEFKE